MKKVVKNALILGALVAAPAIINNAVFSRAKALGNPIGGEGRFWPWREGDLFYTRQGQGKPPVVLLHGIYAGASIYEFRKNFDVLGEHFTVYALDWLGFGLSDKPKTHYSSQMYVDMLCDFLQEVVGEPCAVVATSLAAAYAIEAAAARPELIESLILICPTGMGQLSESGKDVKNDVIYHFVNAPLVGTSLYNGMSSTISLRAYLQNQVYFDPSYVTDEMVDHYSTATHQFNSQYATLCFISGQLNRNVAETLPKLTQKNIRLVWGRESRQTPLSDAEPFLAANSNVEMTVFDKAGMLPHDEQASAFNRLVTEILTSEHSGEAKHARSRKKE